MFAKASGNNCSFHEHEMSKGHLDRSFGCLSDIGDSFLWRPAVLGECGLQTGCGTQANSHRQPDDQEAGGSSALHGKARSQGRSREDLCPNQICESRHYSNHSNPIPSSPQSAGWNGSLGSSEGDSHDACKSDKLSRPGTDRDPALITYKASLKLLREQQSLAEDP